MDERIISTYLTNCNIEELRKVKVMINVVIKEQERIAKTYKPSFDKIDIFERVLKGESISALSNEYKYNALQTRRYFNSIKVRILNGLSGKEARIISRLRLTELKKHSSKLLEASKIEKDKLLNNIKYDYMKSLFD